LVWREGARGRPAGGARHQVVREDGRGAEMGCAAGRGRREVARPEPASRSIGVVAGGRAVARGAAGWVRRGWLLGWRGVVRLPTFLRSAVGLTSAEQPAA
jgi:hypothetical protein